MTAVECRRFLLDRPRNIRLATVRSDGRPHVVPVWFDLDGDDVIIWTDSGSVKARNIARDPRVALSVDDDGPPWSFVMIDGIATIERDPRAVRWWGYRIGQRYEPSDAPPPDPDSTEDIGGACLIRVRPSKVIARVAG
ncbi:MAG: PPOX class F420-dependent oxidoreductase [Dehalococcoidia bacterium]|nr:PPOX class F420-dependent oxidoreductase [Dehalococcoidia bacterium]